MAPQSKRDLGGLLGGESSRSERLPGGTALGTRHCEFLGFRSQSLLLWEVLCNNTGWCLWALGKNVILLIPFSYNFAIASRQAKHIWLVLGRCCHSSFPVSVASPWAFPALLCCAGFAQSSRAVCWLLPCFTVENSSTSVTYRKRMNISFKWPGRMGRKRVIL